MTAYAYAQQVCTHDDAISFQRYWDETVSRLSAAGFNPNLCMTLGGRFCYWAVTFRIRLTK